MELVYIAGKYRGDTIREIVENIQEAEKVAIKYWKLGYAVICPHKNTELFDGIVDLQVFLDGDLEMVRRCDSIVMMSNYKDSKGALGELALARELNKEIIYE